MSGKKDFKLTDDLIKEALDLELASVDAPPSDQLWQAIEARLEGAPAPSKRYAATWNRIAAVAAVFFLLVISTVILSRSLQLPSPSSDLVIMPIEPFKEVVVLDVEDKTIVPQDEPAVFVQPEETQKPVVTEEPETASEIGIAEEEEVAEESVAIAEADLPEAPEKTDKTEATKKPDAADSETQQPAEKPEQPKEAEPEELEQPVVVAEADSPEKKEGSETSEESDQPEVGDDHLTDNDKPFDDREKTKDAGEILIASEPGPGKRAEKAPPDWPTSLPGGYLYKGMVDLKSKSEPLYKAAVYRSESADLLLVKSEDQSEELTVFVDRLSKKMQILLTEDEEDLSTICPDLKTCSGLAWEKNGRNQALLVLFGSVEEEELVDILMKLE